MTSASRITKLKALIFALAAVLPLSALAAAQGARGKFTLSTPIRWGMATLPEGEYVYWVTEASPTTMVVLQNLTHKQGFLLLPQGTSLVNSEESKLVIERDGGEMFVRALYLGAMGEVLYFNGPRQRPVIARSTAGSQDRGTSSGNIP